MNLIKVFLALTLMSTVAFATSTNVSVDSQIEVKGYADSTPVEHSIDVRLYHIKNCYLELLKKNAKLVKIKMNLSFDISSEGAPQNAALSDWSTKSSELESCIIPKVMQWKFAKPDAPTDVNQGGHAVLNLTLTGKTAP